MQIEHVAIWTHDLERLRAFYEAYFGARLCEKDSLDPLSAMGWTLFTSSAPPKASSTTLYDEVMGAAHHRSDFSHSLMPGWAAGA